MTIKRGGIAEEKPTLSQLLLSIGTREFEIKKAQYIINIRKKQLKQLYNFDYKDFKRKANDYKKRRSSRTNQRQHQSKGDSLLLSKV